ncbi:MAG: hypothetical protein ACM34K_01315, partial [Bacillota bacterium]
NGYIQSYNFNATQMTGWNLGSGSSGNKLTVYDAEILLKATVQSTAIRQFHLMADGKLRIGDPTKTYIDIYNYYANYPFIKFVSPSGDMGTIVAMSDVGFVIEGVNFQVKGTDKLSLFAPMIGFFDASPVAKPTALTAANNSLIPGTFDATAQAIIANLRTRLNEFETKFKSLGLIS